MTEPSAATHDLPVPGVHELLLELAGRLDDDLLAWARELVAVGEEGQAVELAVAALVAERVTLTPDVRTLVVTASHTAHTDLDAETALAPAITDGATGHRFDAAAGSGDRVAAVLAALPARRLAGCTLHLTWRLTPAGAAPGPVPRAVVLVETGPDRSADVLAYLLATELDRADVPASVEVFTAGSALPAYHVAALRSAQQIEVGASVIAPAGVVVARTAAEAAARAEPVDAEPADLRTDTASLFVVSSGGDAAAAPGDARRAGRRRRRESTDVAAAGPEPEVPDGAPDTDPFHGPLRVPLLAPLLDPTSPDAGDRGRAAVPTPIRPAPAQPAADVTEEAAEPASPETGEPAPSDQTRPVAPVAAAEPAVPGADVPDDLPQEWEDDWRSGEWAMPPTGRPQPSTDHFDVFEPPASQTEANAAEQTSRTELPSRVAPEPPPNRSDLPLRVTPDRHAPEPSPTPDGPELPSRERHRPEQPRPAGPFRGSPLEAGADGTAALPSRGNRDDGAPHRGPTSEPPADVSLFDSPTARVGPAQRRTPPAPDPAPAGPGEVSLFGEPAPDRSSDPDRPGRRRRPDADEPEPGAEAEPSLRSSTERDLLSQLQAELAEREHRPRPYRRASSAVTPAVNGHGVNGHGINGHGSEGPHDGHHDGHGPDGPGTG